MESYELNAVHKIGITEAQGDFLVRNSPLVAVLAKEANYTAQLLMKEQANATSSKS